MKKKFYVTKGLSHSGKSTWAKEKAKELGWKDTVIITKDDIRQEMGANLIKGIRVKEGKVIEKRNEMILEALKKGKNIISADTNFAVKVDHIANMKALVFPKYRISCRRLYSCAVRRDFRKS
jgi:predicted kinase